MHIATIRLPLCLLFCSYLRPANSQKPRIDSIDSSELVPKARDVRQHRQIRRTLFILTEVGNLISNIFVDIAIWSFFKWALLKLTKTCSKFRIFVTYSELPMRSCYVTEFKHKKK